MAMTYPLWLFWCGRVVRTRQPRPGDRARVAAELGDHNVACGDADVINPGPAVARNFPRGRDQHVAELAGTDEGDVALRGDRALVARVAGKGEGGIGQQEDETAMISKPWRWWKDSSLQTRIIARA